MLDQLKLSYDTVQEKWHIIQLIFVFNSVIGVGFLFSTLFVGSIWGSGAGFQAVTTALANLCFSGYVTKWINVGDLHNTDFLGAIALMLTLLLLQTWFLWSNFVSGFTENGLVGCKTGGSAEQAVSAFASLLFLTFCGLIGLVWKWKSDLLDGQTAQYSEINTSNVEKSQASYQTGHENSENQFAIGDEDNDDI